MSQILSWNQLFPVDQPPSMEQIDRYTDNPLWPELRQYLKEVYGAEPQPVYSRCGLEPGWNVKFKKGSKALATVYFRPGYATAMVSVAPRDEAAAEAALLTCTEYVKELYRRTSSSKMGRWLMLDLTSPEVLEDVKALLAVRVKPAGK
ncbi:MAG: DUF3788 domain-containing protein [Oscillibacter sp.]|nr:DUF3788 domain-containing protein [Oscillibacter sp.]